MCWDLVHLSSRCTGSRVELVNEQTGKLVVFHKIQGVLEVLISLTGKSTDYIRRNRYPRYSIRKRNTLDCCWIHSWLITHCKCNVSLFIYFLSFVYSLFRMCILDISVLPIVKIKKGKQKIINHCLPWITLKITVQRHFLTEHFEKRKTNFLRHFSTYRMLMLFPVDSFSQSKSD